MKTFYTEQDIEEMAAQGLTQIVVTDDVVLTDLAREKAQDVGMSLTTGSVAPSSPLPSPQKASTPQPMSNTDLVDHVKARVMARLGTAEYNDVLDQVIPQVLANLNLQTQAHNATNNSSSSGGY